MKKLSAVFMCVILILMSLSGCSLSLNSQDLMVPPKPSGDEARVLSLIEEQAGPDYELVIPTSGDNKTAFISHDLNGDGKEEAVTIYRAVGELHFLFLNMPDSTYETVLDITSPATSVDRVDFSDIDGDGVKEVLIGTSNNAILNTLSIYKFTDTVTQLATDIAYTTYTTGNFTSSEHEDILTLSFHTDIANNASLIANDGSGVKTLSSCDIDNGIYSIEGVQFGPMTPTENGAFIDAIGQSDSYLSQVIYYSKDSKSLQNPLYTNTDYNTRRSLSVRCTDINEDGIIDIPMSSFSNVISGENETGSSYTSYITWSDYDTETSSLVPVRENLYNSHDEYMFTLPDNWSEGTAAKYDLSTRELTIYENSYDQSEPTTAILTIKTLGPDASVQDTDSFKELFKNEKYTYMYAISENDSYMTITDDDVVNNFTAF